MRLLLYICILALLPFAPVQQLDVAKLEPVQTVAVSVEAGQVVIETDTQNRGQGRTIKEAVEDLEANTPGVIYLDTAQYLLITEEAMRQCEELKSYMTQTVYVSLWDGKGSIETAAQYLEIRRDLPKLRDLDNTQCGK